MRLPSLLRPFLTREVLTFLAVGGTGYVVDVTAFNVLRAAGPLATMAPSGARTLAVVAAMTVTYTGNRAFTWSASANRRREVGLFVLFNVIAFGFSVVTLVVSHDLLGFTSRLSDNISANVIGLALGTAFRFVTYKAFVFAPAPAGERVHGDARDSAATRTNGTSPSRSGLGG